MLKLDPRNANKGTERGEYMLGHSLSQYGAGRSVLVDKHGVLIAGNKTYSKAQELGIPVRIVETDGTELVAVKRTDLDLATDAAAVELGVVDNRSGEVGLEWDPEVLRGLAEEVDLSAFWFEPELDRLLTDMADAEPFDPAAEWQGMPEFHQDDQTAEFKCIVNFATVEDMERFEQLVGQRVPRNTKSIWYPAQERSRARELEYVTDAA